MDGGKYLQLDAPIEREELRDRSTDVGCGIYGKMRTDAAAGGRTEGRPLKFVRVHAAGQGERTRRDGLISLRARDPPRARELKIFHSFAARCAAASTH